jgi:hypothetical protein
MWLLALTACTAPEPASLPPRLVLNELGVENDSVLPTPDGRYVGWLELYNGSAVDVDLADVVLSDGAIAWTGAGTLGPGGRRLLWADGSGGPDAVNFVLSDGDRVAVAWQGREIDAVVVPAGRADTAWARFPDGGATWAVSARPTPGRTNGARPPDDADPSDALFQDGRVLDFEIFLDAAALQGLADDPRTDVAAAFAYGEARFDAVAARIKGGYGSTRAIDQKCAFKLDLNQFDDHRLRGLEALTVNNLVQDPSYVHESLSYELFRAAGVPAPRVGWARLWVNGRLHGLMLNVETVDDRFLDRWFADNDGYLFEGAYGADFVDGYEYFEVDEGPDEDLSSISAVTALVAGTPSEPGLNALEKRVDMDNLITVMAVEAVSLHWDGYTTSNNYRMYLDPDTQRFTMIPWGTDQTFYDVWFGPYDGYGRLFTYCLAVPSCRDRYDAELRRVAALMKSLPLVERLEARAAWLRADIEADPQKEFDLATHDAWVSNTAGVIAWWPDTMLAYVP